MPKENQKETRKDVYVFGLWCKVEWPEDKEKDKSILASGKSTGNAVEEKK